MKRKGETGAERLGRGGKKKEGDTGAEVREMARETVAERLGRWR